MRRMILLAALALTLTGCATQAPTPAHTSAATTPSPAPIVTVTPAATPPSPTPASVDYLAVCQPGATTAGLGTLGTYTVGAKQNDGSLRVTVSDGMTNADCYVKGGKAVKVEAFG